MKTTCHKDYTIIVNSCDRYEDLWVPFFTLLKKYWDPVDVRLILNTESKDFRFDGLSIECIHPADRNDPYGKRMINVLSQVTTPYVIPLLDDFFIRKEVDHDLLDNIIRWMDEDKRIVYFNCDCTPTFYYDYEVNVYPGFRRLPNGNEYTLNMQAAVWRTKKLLAYWRPQVSPWEWEMYTNLIAARSKTDRFYCVTDPEYSFCDYGYSYEGMGVFRGKWVKDDVVPLFEREGIHVDYAKRGFFSPEAPSSSLTEIRNHLKTVKTESKMIDRCLDRKSAVLYSVFIKRNKVLGMIRFPSDILYIKYALAREQKRFMKTMARKQRLTAIMKRGLKWRKYP